MNANKTKISVTISALFAKLLEQSAAQQKLPKSQIVETALEKLFQNQLAEEAKKLSNINFEDLPSESEWEDLQTPLPQ